MAGRHGIKMRSAALTAAMAACSARGGVSMNTRSAPAFPAAWRTRDSRAGWAETTAGDSASRRSDHLLVVAYGSRSTMTTERPAGMAATARETVRVVFRSHIFGRRWRLHACATL